MQIRSTCIFVKKNNTEKGNDVSIENNINVENIVLIELYCRCQLAVFAVLIRQECFC